MTYATNVPVVRLQFSDGFKYYGDATTLSVSATVNLSVSAATHRTTGETITDGGLIPAQDVATFDVPRVDRRWWVTPSGSTLGGWSYDLAVTAKASGKPTILWTGTVTPRGTTEVITPGLGTITGVDAGSTTDHRVSLYNFKPAQVMRLRAALGRAYAGTGAANLAFVGDSTTAGVGALSAPWPKHLVDRLSARGYKTTGTGLVAAHKGGAGNDPRWSLGSGWSGATSSSNLLQNSTNTNPATFTSTTTGTVARVFYANTSGPFTVSIDGAAPVTVTPTTYNAPGTYEVTGLTNTTHTISVVRGASGTTRIFGAEIAAGNTGIRPYNAGIAGARTTPGSQQYWFGVELYATAPGAFNADCVFYMFQTNDVVAATPVATYKSNIQSSITNMRNNGADVVLVTAVPSDVSGTQGAATFPPYTTALYELADENDLPLIDLHDRLGTYARSNALGLMADPLHPTAAGYATVADAVATAIGLG